MTITGWHLIEALLVAGVVMYLVGRLLAGWSLR